MPKRSFRFKILRSFILTLLLFPIVLPAQDPKQRIIDSLTLKLAKDSTFIYRFKKVRPYFSIDYRNAALRTAPVDVEGAQLGVRLFDKHKVGIGGYDMANWAKQKVKAFEIEQNANQELKLWYFMAFYEYSVIDRRFFELTSSAEAGGGRYSLKYFNLETDEQKDYFSDYILPLGSGLTLNLKPLKWIGLSGTAGLRYMFGIAGKRINFNGIFYSYGIWIDLRQIYRDTRYYGFKKPKYRKKIKEITATNA